MNTQQFIKINKQIVEDIKKELRLQGHYAFGELEASMTDKEFIEGNDFILSAQSLAYLEELEKGVPANKINVPLGDMPKLVKWIKLRFGVATDKEATKIAFAIIHKWKRQGKPLPTSRRYSKTGDITNAVEINFRNNEQKYFAAIDKAAVDELDNSFSKIKSGVI